MAKIIPIQGLLSFKSDGLYRPNTFNWQLYSNTDSIQYYTVYRFFAYKDSPGEVVEIKVYAPNPIEAYIAVLDMGYTPVEYGIMPDLRKW